MSDREKYVRTLNKLSGFPSGEYFYYTSYSHWAANYIFSYIEDHPHMNPKHVAEIFITKFDRYSTVSQKTSFMYSVAKDIAEDIYDYYDMKDRWGTA